MPRRVTLFVLISAAAFTLGVLILAGVFFSTETTTSSYPAPARVPVVVGLTKEQAVRRIEAAKLKTVVRYKRLRGVRHGRIISMQITSLLQAPRLPLISLEGTPVVVFVALRHRGRLRLAWPGQVRRARIGRWSSDIPERWRKRDAF